MKHAKIENSLGCHKSAVTAGLYPGFWVMLKCHPLSCPPTLLLEGWLPYTVIRVRPWASPYACWAVTPQAALCPVVSVAFLTVPGFPLTRELLEALSFSTVSVADPPWYFSSVSQEVPP